MTKRVHVVDDDASFRTAIERRLKRAGYNVAAYPSAQQLLDDLPQEDELGCVLLDVQIPGMTGPELQDRLRHPRIYAANHLCDRYSRCPDHGEDHKGGRRGFSHQADIFR